VHEHDLRHAQSYAT